MRNMTPEEQQLMRETRSGGRARMENQPGEGTRSRGGGGGRGHCSSEVMNMRKDNCYPFITK